MAAAESTSFRRPAFTVGEVFTVLLLLLLIWFAGRIFLMAFGGLLVGVLLNMLAGALSRHSFLSYGWALAVVIVAIMALAVSTFWLIGSHLATQASDLTEVIPSALRQIQDELSEKPWGKWILEQSPDWGRAIAQGGFPSRITDLAGSIVDMIAAFVIMIFVGLYIAAEPQLYANGLVRLVPIHSRQRAREVLDTLLYNLRWWLAGQLFAMVCVGLIAGLGMWIVGVKLALTLGLLAGLLEIIPNIGPVLWLIPALLVATPQGTHEVLAVVAVYAATHMLESYVLIPLVQRRTVWLPPTLSILAAVLLGVLAGFLGLLVATPLALVVMLLVKMLYVEDRLGDHSLQVPGQPAERPAKA